MYWGQDHNDSKRNNWKIWNDEWIYSLWNTANWLEGKTEMQENNYSIYTSISEVYKKRVVTEEYLTEEEIECGDYEFI